MPANYNFFEFLVSATTLGATRIALDTTHISGKFSREDTQRRIENILIPGCELAGVEVCISSEGEDIANYHISALIDAYNRVGTLKKLKSVLPPGNERYTVTLRDYDRYPRRNSNRENWLKFAKTIGARVIDDWYLCPIGLHERMALYAGAEMNFHVANGPAILCYLSDAPITAFLKNVDADYHARHGFPVGSQLPWLNKNQRFVWRDDTYENLMAHNPLRCQPGKSESFLPPGEHDA